MAPYGITSTQLAEYTAMISANSNQEFTAINQGGCYKRFCAAQDFQELLGLDITINNIEAIDYNEWKKRVNEVQRSSTPLFGSRDTELWVVPCEENNAALLMLMGQRLMEEDTSININKSQHENAALLMLMGQGLLTEHISINMFKTIEANDYNEWEMIIHEAQRSSTPLFGSQEQEMLVPFEKEEAALFMLMGHRIIETDF